MAGAAAGPEGARPTEETAPPVAGWLVAARAAVLCTTALARHAAAVRHCRYRPRALGRVDGKWSRSRRRDSDDWATVW